MNPQVEEFGLAVFATAIPSRVLVDAITSIEASGDETIDA